MKKIALAIPDITGNEQKYVLDAMQSTWISSIGPYVDRFEQQFASACAAKTSIVVCNGTIALHLALLALDLRPGDEVIVPSLTYVATANAVRYLGAEPVFVDIHKDTWCLDPALIEEKITRKTKGIIAVHLYGHPADMDEINHIAAIHGLWVIEDAAEAHFAKYKNRYVGNLSRLATFSFYGNKIITSGEGGAITLNDTSLEIRIRALRGQGADPRRRYYFPIVGYNFRLTNIACAILCAQLERYEDIIESRNRIFNLYKECLNDIPGIRFQPIAHWAEPAPWLFSITINKLEYGRSRSDLIDILNISQIETRPFFIPLHTLPPYRNESISRKDYLPVTDALSLSGLNLPTHKYLSNEDVIRISEIIRKNRI